MWELGASEVAKLALGKINLDTTFNPLSSEVSLTAGACFVLLIMSI